jgi:hypothetical protein
MYKLSILAATILCASVSAFMMPTEYGMMQRIAMGSNRMNGIEQVSAKTCDGAFGYCNSWG